MTSSVSTIGTPMSFRQGTGRPPRQDSPSSRKRRAAAATTASSTAAVRPSTPTGSAQNASLGGSSSMGGDSEQSSGQFRPSHSFGMNMMFGGFDDDLDNFAQYADAADDEDEDYGHGEEVVPTRVASFDSYVESPEPKGKGMLWLFRFDRRRKKKNHKAATTFGSVDSHTIETMPPKQTLPYFHHQQRPKLLQHQSAPSVLVSQQYHAKSRPPQETFPLHPTQYARPTMLKDVSSGCITEITEIHGNTSHGQRSRSSTDFRTYNEPKATLPRLGSFDLDIDTVPASPRTTTVSPLVDVQDTTVSTEEDQRMALYPSWKTTASTASVLIPENETSMVPYGVELVDQSSTTESAGLPLANYIDRTDSWNRRLDRTDIYHRHYVPSPQELAELKDLEDYLGIFASPTKHRFATLWRQLVPPLDTVKQRSGQRPSHASISSLSTLSSVTNRPPVNFSSKSKPPYHSIVLKRGPIQFQEHQDYQCEWILMTRGFVVARPNYQFIPRFQAGDMWASVVQVHPTNPLSITLSCTSRSTSSHLTLAQLKQQQRYGCYTYQISCETPQEQASWLEALRRVVIQAHDSAGTNEKEMGGLGWQYRVVYVPFFTEAVTGNPIQKEKILAGSSGHIDLNALDSYNSYAPLHYATRANHVRVMRFLLEAGADVHVGDGYGRTPMYYAELHQLPEATIQLLEANGAQRAKKSAGGGSSRNAFRRRSCLLRLVIAAMVFLLLACGTAALLWHFGKLEIFGIRGNKEEASVWSSELTAAPTSSVVVSSVFEPSGAPSTLPIFTEATPPLLTREGDTVSPNPTWSPSYVKTPLPTIATTSPRQSLPQETPTVGPTSSAFNSDLFQLLESASFDAGEALRVTGSPQQRAFFWLLENANLDAYTNSRRLQRYAMAVFYYSTNGENWSDNQAWMSDEDECLWFNKEAATNGNYSPCQINVNNDAQKTISALDLSFNNVQGTIPPEIGLLSGLLRLDLDGGPSGFLVGSLPTEIGFLNLLTSFSARGNQLTGTLPNEVGNWEQVTGIDLSFNKLTGLLPSAFGTLTWLTELTLEMNNFTGSLPTELGRLSNLFKLALGGNQFQGPLFPEIGSLTKLRYLYLELNQFSSLPTEIGRLENLSMLSAFENDFQGSIPSELGRLTLLGSLLLRSNSFSSSVPSELGLMRGLQNSLDLSFNNIEGPIPSELGSLTSLRSLYLQSNRISGAIPDELSMLSQLNTLRVESNNIVGAVPTPMCAIFDTTFPIFYADCVTEVSCSCCTYCCTDGDACTCEHAETAPYLC